MCGDLVQSVCVCCRGIVFTVANKLGNGGIGHLEEDCAALLKGRRRLPGQDWRPLPALKRFFVLVFWEL